MNHVIFCDTETGGLDPFKHDILTVALVDWRDGVIGDSVEYKVVADPKRVTTEALAVNRIDLKAHNAKGLPAVNVAFAMREWISKRWLGDRVRLGGHNVSFDVGFLRALIGPAYGRTFSHRPICTMNMLPLLWHAGIIPNDMGKLTEACDALGVPMPATEAHTALGDALASARLYTAMLKRVRP